MYGLINIKKEGNLLKVKDYGGYETRNSNTIKLAAKTLKNINKDIEFNIYTEDKPVKNINGIRTFSYSTTEEDYSLTCPDFLFHSWKEVGIDSYEEECKKINNAGNYIYDLNKIGWIGSFTNPLRKELYNFYLLNKDILDMRVTNFTKNSDGKVQAINFLTLEQQIKTWKYLLDIEGNGWSARLKLLLWSGRPVLLIERSYKEFFYQFLKPWEHYIPVKKDFSDFKQNFSIIENDKNLYENISKNSIKFANQYLTTEYAINYWSQLF